MTFPMTHHNAPNRKALPTDASGETEVAPVMSAADTAFAQIRARLDRHFPADPYLPDSLLAGTLGMTQKTLANRRSLEPDKYPSPLKLGGGRTGMHPRGEFIDWLARAELKAKATSCTAAANRPTAASPRMQPRPRCRP